MRTYRPCVGIALFDDAGHVFVGERIQQRDSWQMPQGGIDKGETPLEAARRELKEETGVSRATLLAQTLGWLHYEIPSTKGKHRGQKQVWFAFRVQDKSEINVAQQHAEFRSFKFIPLVKTIDSIVGFKREVYRQVHTLFAAIEGPMPSEETRRSFSKIAVTGNVSSHWAF